MKQAAAAEPTRKKTLVANEALLNQALAGTGMKLKFDGDCLSHETPRFDENHGHHVYIAADGKEDYTSPEHKAAAAKLKALNAVGAIGPFNDNQGWTDTKNCDRLVVFSINPEKLKTELVVNPAQQLFAFPRGDQGKFRGEQPAGV